MEKLTYLSSVLVALSLSTTALAETTSPHSVGLQIGGGSMEYKDKKGEGYATSYLYYNNQFSKFYSLEAGLLIGADADWNCKSVDGQWDCYPDTDDKDVFELDADKLELSAFVVAIKTDLALSKRNTLYGKAGLSYYAYELDLDRQKIADENGVGLMLEAGWEYRWDMGIGMNAGLQYHKMDDLESSTINLGISYAF